MSDLRERVAREIHNADASAEPWSSTSWDAAYRVADAVIAIVVEACADVVIRRAAPTAFACREFACAVCGRPVALGETVHPECRPASPAQENKS